MITDTFLYYFYCYDNNKNNYYIQLFNDGTDLLVYNQLKKINVTVEYFFRNILSHLIKLYKGLTLLHINNYVHLDIKPKIYYYLNHIKH